MKKCKIDILQFVEKDCTESFRLFGVDCQKQDAFDTLGDGQKERYSETGLSRQELMINDKENCYEKMYVNYVILCFCCSIGS